MPLREVKTFRVEAGSVQRRIHDTGEPVSSHDILSVQRVLPGRLDAFEPHPTKRCLLGELLPRRRSHVVPAGGIRHIQLRLHQRAHPVGPRAVEVTDLHEPCVREGIEVSRHIDGQPLGERREGLLRHRRLEHPRALDERERVLAEGGARLVVGHVLQEQPRELRVLVLALGIARLPYGQCRLRTCGHRRQLVIALAREQRPRPGQDARVATEPLCERLPALERHVRQLARRLPPHPELAHRRRLERAERHKHDGLLVAGHLELGRRGDEQLGLARQAHRQQRLEQRRGLGRDLPRSVIAPLQVLLEVVEHDGHWPPPPVLQHPLHPPKHRLVGAGEQALRRLVTVPRGGGLLEGFEHAAVVNRAVQHDGDQLGRVLLRALQHPPDRARLADPLHAEHARTRDLERAFGSHVLPAKQHAEQPLHQAPPPDEAALEHAHLAGEVAVDLVAIEALLLEWRRLLIEPEARSRAAHQVQRPPRVLRARALLLEAAQVRARELHGLRRRLAGAKLLVERRRRRGGIVVAHRPRPAEHVGHAAGDQLRGEARHRATHLGAVAARDHHQLGHRLGALEHREHLRRRHQSLAAQQVLHREPRAIRRERAVAGQVHDIVGVEQKDVLELVEGALLHDPHAGAALLHKGCEHGEHLLLLALVVEHGRALGRERHEQDAQAAGVEQPRGSGLLGAELQDDGERRRAVAHALGKREKLPAHPRGRVLRERTAVGGAGADDDLEVVVVGFCRGDALAEGALRAVEQAEERRAQGGAGLNDRGRVAAALGQLDRIDAGAEAADLRCRDGLVPGAGRLGPVQGEAAVLLHAQVDDGDAGSPHTGDGSSGAGPRM